MDHNNVFPFQRSNKKYDYTAETYLWFILTGLSQIFGNDNHLKAEYIRDHCPRLSMAMLERFHGKVSASCQEFYATRDRTTDIPPHLEEISQQRESQPPFMARGGTLLIHPLPYPNE